MLPFIHLDSSNPSTIYTALCFAKNQCELQGIKTCFVTFDQLLYIHVNTVEIVAASTDLGNVVVTSQAWWFPSSYILLGCSRIHHGWQWIGNRGKLFIPQDQ